MKRAVSEISVRPNDTLNTVLATLHDNVHCICLVTSADGELIGTITDGDCRRALLRGCSLDAPASEVMCTSVIMVDATFSPEQIQSLMRTNRIKQVPIIDEHRRLLDIVSEHSLFKAPSARPNSALILAGGKGQRLRPLTNATPKPMLPLGGIGGKPMLERLIVGLVSSGIETIYISINYLGHVIRDYFGDGARFGCRLNYLVEEQELGTAGPLRLIADPPKVPLLIMNGDLVTNVDFGALLDFYVGQPCSLLVGVSSHIIKIPFGVVSTDERGAVISVEEKPDRPFKVNAGVYVANPSVISLVPEGRYFTMVDLMNELVAQRHSVIAFPIHEQWMDVGLPDQYFKALSEDQA